jgi:hypothetical protein
MWERGGSSALVRTGEFLAARVLGVREVVGADRLVNALWGERPRGAVSKRSCVGQATKSHS